MIFSLIDVYDTYRSNVYITMYTYKDIINVKIIKKFCMKK